MVALSGSAQQRGPPPTHGRPSGGTALALGAAAAATAARTGLRPVPVCAPRSQGARAGACAAAGCTGWTAGAGAAGSAAVIGWGRAKAGTSGAGAAGGPVRLCARTTRFGVLRGQPGGMVGNMAYGCCSWGGAAGT